MCIYVQSTVHIYSYLQLTVISCIYTYVHIYVQWTDISCIYIQLTAFGSGRATSSCAGQVGHLLVILIVCIHMSKIYVSVCI